MDDRPNVLLVVLDSARAANTSLHGYERETTPFLETFAERSTLYRQARAPSIHSIASHVSMFTGAHVEEHDAVRHTSQIDPKQSIWHELGAARDYSTGLFTNNRIVSNASNLSDCFDYTHNPEYSLAKRLENTLGHPLIEQAYFRADSAVARISGAISRVVSGGKGPLAPVRALSDRVGNGTDTAQEKADSSSQGSDSGFKTIYGEAFADAFLDWERDQSGSWAACINLMDPHSPYEPEPEYDRWASEDDWNVQENRKPSVRETLHGDGWDRFAQLEALYDGSILQSDAVVRSLVESLESRDVLDETLLIVTSDHGEAFGEYSRIDPEIRLRDHKWGIHEVLTHVPLLVRYPGDDSGRVVDEVVSLTDIPDAIRATVEDGQNRANGDNTATDPFVTDGPVIASTYRMPERKTSKYASVTDIDAYVGPWRAVYETEDNGVRKFARRREDAVTIDIAQDGTCEIIERDDGGRVETEYERLSNGGVLTERETEIDDELEEQLEDLGYIR